MGSNEGEATTKTEQYLRNLYYNPKSPVAYSGLGNIWKKVKEDREAWLKTDRTSSENESMSVRYQDLKDFLQNQPTYQLHKKDVKKFPFRKTMVSYVDQQWQADLVDMQAFEKDNKNYRFILTVIDILSRYAWAKPLKSKKGEEVRDAFVDIFEEAVPEKIQFDEGKEFYNRHFKALLEEKDIEYFSTKSDKKAAIVERFNLTLKQRMWKYFTAKETHKWDDVLDDFVNDYNNSFHSGIGMKPVDARKEENEGTVWYNLYGVHLLTTFGEPKFKVGNSVRIAKYKTVFTKGYLPNFTEEVFKIKQIIFTQPVVYKLEDYQNEPIEGYFYEEELSFVPNPDDIEYKIEKVLRYKTVKGRKYGLVKWKGYSDQFSSWEPVSKIKAI